VNYSELLAVAVGIALNPPAVVAVILMLSSARPARNALAFVSGWVVGLVAAGGPVLLLGDLGALLGDPGIPALAIQLLLGLTLVVGAVMKWTRDRSSEGPKEMPGWMRSLQGFSARKAFVTAALYAGLNPKTLALNVAGVLLIIEAEVALTTQIAALALFIAVASITVALPVAYYLVARESSKAALDATQVWLINHAAAITAVVLLVLGVIVTTGAAEGLLAMR
jgi:hypothetical protein